MDQAWQVWHYSDMTDGKDLIPAWQLYGEDLAFPDVMHVEQISDRAAGLHWAIAPHRHLHLHQFFLITHGHATMTVDGQQRDLVPPVLLSVPAGTVHGFDFAPDTQGFVLTIPRQTLPEVFDQTSDLVQFRMLAGGEPFTPQFHAILAEYTTSAPLRSQVLRALATQIAVAAIRQLDASQDANQPSDADPRITRFAALVLAHFRDRWPLSAYAAALAISPRHLSRLCRRATGLSGEKFIETTTFREACRLLAYTRMTASAVGYHLGFEDPSYFSRAFQRHTGLSPTAYRRRFD